MPVIKTKLQIVQTPVRLAVSRSADLSVALLLLKYLITKVRRMVPEIDWFSPFHHYSYWFLSSFIIVGIKRDCSKSRIRHHHTPTTSRQQAKLWSHHHGERWKEDGVWLRVGACLSQQVRGRMHCKDGNGSKIPFLEILLRCSVASATTTMLLLPFEDECHSHSSSTLCQQPPPPSLLLSVR